MTDEMTNMGWTFISSAKKNKKPFTLFLGCMCHFAHVRRLSLSDTQSDEIKGAFSPEALDMCGHSGRAGERNKQAWFCSETPERFICSNNTTDAATGHKMTCAAWKQNSIKFNVESYLAVFIPALLFP